MKTEPKKQLFSKTFSLAFISIIQKILGLLKNLIFSFLYGTSSISDAYNISLAVPDTVYSLFSNGISSSFIPLYSAEKDLQKKELTSEMVTLVFVVTLFVCILCFCFLDKIVYLFAPGFDDSTRKTTTQLVSISLWSIVFSGMSNLLVAFLHTTNCFIIPELTTIVLNVFQCFGMIISFYKKLFWLAVGILLGSVIQCIILFCISIRKNYSISFVVPKKATVKQVVTLAFPIFLSASANRINVLMDKAIASSIIIGGVSALAYADSIVLFIKSVFGTPIITTVYPQLTVYVSQDDSLKVKEMIENSIEKILFYILPICIGCLLVSNEFITIIYKRGAFSIQSVILTSDCLIWYSIGLPAFCLRDLLVRLYYAKKDSNTPTKNLFIGLILNLLLNFLLSRIYGLKGLAMATSLSAYIILALLYGSLKRKAIFQLSNGLILKTIRIIICSILMFVCLLGIKVLVNRLSSTLLRFLLLLFSGVVCYCFLLVITKTYTIKSLEKKLLLR